MAEFLWTFAVQEILKKSVQLAAEQISLSWSFKKEISKLHSSLLLVEAILRDIHSAKANRESVKIWVSKLQDLAFEAEVLMDELSYENLRFKVEIHGNHKKKVRDFFSFSNPFIFRLKMAHRIKTITRVLNDIKGEASSVGVVSEVVNEEMKFDKGLIPETETDSFLDEFEVKGRRGDISKILKIIIDSIDQERICVIPILGMGGLGKTTLAKSVFNHELVKTHFDVTIWVCVTTTFDDKKILRAILESITDVPSGLDSKDAILKRLQKELEGKKYFLVLDDVWNENAKLWNNLKSNLLKITSSSGNKVLVTTRSEEAAKIMETFPIYHLGKLSDDECWSIFKERASANGLPLTPELDIIKNVLAEQFGGIPLVAKVLGGAVQFKIRKETWLMSTLETLIMNPLQNENDVLSILRLSVDHLPNSSLKQCFAYFSNFPKGFNFEKEQLINFWMAEGFIQPSQVHTESIEDIGDKYFNILLARSFFQDIVKDQNGKITHCKMHHLLHDLAHSVSKSEASSSDHAGLVDNVHKIRQLSLIGCEQNVPLLPAKNLRKLRSLFLDRDVFGHKIVNFTCLRVLNMTQCEIQSLPSSIGGLKHLRYLDISDNMIKELPKSIVKLYKLQTLRLGCFHGELPKKFRKLISLRHFYMNIKRPNVRHMPSHLGRLIELRTLPFFVVGTVWGSRIEELGYLSNLKGKLKIYNLESIRKKEESMRSELVKKKDVYKLRLVWSAEREVNDNNDGDVLEGLQPHRNLQSLTVENFMGSLFPSLTFVEGLVKISLKNCIRCNTIPTLGQLPNLKVLEICGLHNIKSIGTEFYGNKHDERGLFPKLKRFNLLNMENLRHWDEAAVPSEVAVFPRLQELKILDCPRLEAAPDYFSTLRRLEIDDVNTPISQTTLQTFRLLGVIHSGNLSGLPEQLGANLSSLEEFKVSYYLHLKSFPTIEWLVDLLKYKIGYDTKWTNIQSHGLESHSSINQLSIVNCPDLTSIPDLQSFCNLSSLTLTGLENFPKGLHCLTCLKSLSIGGSMEGYDFRPLIQLESLEDLALLDFGSTPTALPDQLQHLAGLKYLKIVSFQGIETLPEWLGNLSSLECLHLENCRNLRELPESMGRLAKLEELRSFNCQELRLRQEDPEWAKISHIPTFISFNYWVDENKQRIQFGVCRNAS